MFVNKNRQLFAQRRPSADSIKGTNQWWPRAGSLVSVEENDKDLHGNGMCLDEATSTKSFFVFRGITNVSPFIFCFWRNFLGIPFYLSYNHILEEFLTYRFYLSILIVTFIYYFHVEIFFNRKMIIYN